jgi:ABC-type nitrate/sulfonate/bicarbonate transport system ATPase subunit
LGAFFQSNSGNVAPVSVDFPLLSNQEVCLNIALIKEYHENISISQADNIAFTALQRLGLGHIGDKRNPSLSDEERFCAMLLRAAMVRDAVIVIDRPFKMIPHLKDIGYVLQVLEKIDDLYSICHIYDYKSMEEKYGALCN